MTPSFDHHRSSTRHSHAPLHSQGLLSTILADCVRVRREQGRLPVAVTLDVSPHHEQALLAESTSIRRALELLIRRAFESATQPDSRQRLSIREVVVTSIDVGDAIEIEVADSGPSLSDPVRKWLNGPAGNDPARKGLHAPGDTPEGAGLALAAVRAAAARIDCTLRAANCPEGGVAITLRLPCRQAQRLAA
jgi:C4-dicarboxylate-specific signal transduction histidine kinase